MAWLFERMIELGAWVAFALGIAFLGAAGYLLVVAVQLWLSGNGAEAPDVLVQAALAAGGFVLSALAVGALACIDRYVFDFPSPGSGR